MVVSPLALRLFEAGLARTLARRQAGCRVRAVPTLGQGRLGGMQDLGPARDYDRAFQCFAGARMGREGQDRVPRQALSQHRAAGTDRAAASRRHCLRIAFSSRAAGNAYPGAEGHERGRGTQLRTAPETGDDGIYGDLINIGTLEPRKNQRYLIEVLVRTTHKGHPYTLTLVGDGPDRS